MPSSASNTHLKIQICSAERSVVELSLCLLLSDLSEPCLIASLFCLMKNNCQYSFSVSTAASSSCGGPLGCVLQAGEGCEHRKLTNTPKIVIVKLLQMDPMWTRRINSEIRKAYPDSVYLNSSMLSNGKTL